MECGVFLTNGKWRTIVLSPLNDNNAVTKSLPLAVTFSPVYSNSNTTSEEGSSVAIRIVSLSAAERSSLRPLLRRPVYGSLGLLRIQEEDYLALVSSVQPVGILQGHPIYRVKRVVFVSLNQSGWDESLMAAAGSSSALFSDEMSSFSFEDSNGQARTSPNPNGPPWARLAAYLSSGSFYFCLGWDITRSIQRTVRAGGRKESGFHQPQPPQRPSLLEWDHTEHSFFWNRFMMDPILGLKPQLPLSSQAFLQESGLFLIAMQGSVQIWEAAPSSDSCTVALISRLSCRRAGTRFLSRGIDDDGNVSNFVESETIIVYGEGEGDSCIFSYLLLRGSVPVFWDQQGQRLGYPKVQLTRTPVATQPAFDRHITALNGTYGLVHSIDLLSQKEGQDEQMLASAHEFHARRFPDRNKLIFTSFDMQAAVKYFDYGRLEGLFYAVSRDLQVFGYHLNRRSLGSAEASIVVEREQKGVFRINCLDCLDRTNVAQGFLVRKVVDLFVRTQLANSRLDAALIQQVLGELWARNGDDLSLIYAGTAAQKSSLTRTGKYSLSSLVEDVRKSVQRLYVGSFKDRSKQEAVDLLLGRIPGQRGVLVYDPIGARLRAAVCERAKDLAEWSRVRVQCLTWNTNGVLPSRPEDYVELFRLPPETPQPHIIAVGFQEIVSLNATQVRHLISENFYNSRSCHLIRKGNWFGKELF